MRLVTLSAGVGWHVADLRRAAEARGHQFHVASWTDLNGHVGEKSAAVRSGECNLDSADAVLLRTMPRGSLEQIIFRMDVLRALASRHVTVLNPAQAAEVAIDKYLALQRMAECGLPVSETIACETVESALRAYSVLGGDVVVKPLFGSEGVGVERLTSGFDARRHFQAVVEQGGVVYLQRFIDHPEGDLRVFVLDGRVLASMRRRPAPGQWRSNVTRGGVGEACVADDACRSLAVAAAEACGAIVAGVDILVKADGEPNVVEVNAVPGWRELARVTGIDVADATIAYLERAVRRGLSNDAA